MDSRDSTDRRPIVVGVDRTPESQLALRWATDEAARRDLPVRVVTSFEPPATDPVGVRVPVRPREEDRRAFDEAVGYVRDRLGAQYVSGLLLAVRPAVALVEESANAALVVVGSRSRSTLASVALGSVSSAVAAHAYSPVVVVRFNRSGPSIDRIVVGVDGSAAAEQVVDFAFAEAALHGYRLDVVTCWQASDSLDPSAWTLEKAQTELEFRRATLRSWVAPYAEKYPDVAASTYVLEGRPATVLAAQSRTAKMVVVGSRGHGGVAGLMLGSVSQGLLHHALCTVAVVRPTATTEPN